MRVNSLTPPPARAVPLYFTTSYVFDDSDHAAGLFNLEMPGHLYCAFTNPTVAVLEERLARSKVGSGRSARRAVRQPSFSGSSP